MQLIREVREAELIPDNWVPYRYNVAFRTQMCCPRWAYLGFVVVNWVLWFDQRLVRRGVAGLREARAVSTARHQGFRAGFEADKRDAVIARVSEVFDEMDRIRIQEREAERSVAAQGESTTS